MRLVKTHHRRGSSSSDMTGVIIRREETQSQTQREDGFVMTEAEFGVTSPQAKECQRLSATTTNKEEARKDSLLGPSEGVGPC